MSELQGSQIKPSLFPNERTIWNIEGAFFCENCIDRRGSPLSPWKRELKGATGTIFITGVSSEGSLSVKSLSSEGALEPSLLGLSSCEPLSDADGNSEGDLFGSVEERNRAFFFPVKRTQKGTFTVSMSLCFSLSMSLPLFLSLCPFFWQVLTGNFQIIAEKNYKF
jgi:hypothetical protein